MIVRPTVEGLIKEVIMSIDKSTSFLTSGSNGGLDDEYYINEIIGIEDFTYSDWLRTDQHQLEFDFNNVEVKCEN